MTADEVDTMNQPLVTGLAEAVILGNDASWFVMMVDTPPLQFRHRKVKVGSTTKYMIGPDSEGLGKYVRTRLRLFFSFPWISFFFRCGYVCKERNRGAVLPVISKN